jgi:hypothetical protein
MPQKINQYLKELEGFRDRALSMHHAMKINPDSFQSFVDMEKEIAKEANKGKNRKKKEKKTSI